MREGTPHIAEARRRGLMHVTLEGRQGKTVVLPGGRRVTEFINCSYLGLDQHPVVVARAKAVLDEWGVHFCSARSRFSIGPNRDLEAALSEFFHGRAITFPSVTATHWSVLPLVALGALWPGTRHVRLVFDRFAHASMASLKGALRESARVETIEHNDLGQLEAQFRDAAAVGETPVFVGDSVYSMGGRCPVREVVALAERYGGHAYLDDAHGTSIYGPRGEGAVVEAFAAGHPRVIWAFSLSKGFGANGGGVVLPTPAQEDVVRHFGLTYTFSASLDYSAMAAAQASLELHLDGTAAALRATLSDRVAQFDAEAGHPKVAFSPIRMIARRSAEHAMATGEALIERGAFVSVVLFPVVPRESPQLRVCLAAGHTEADIVGLWRALREIE